MTDFVAFSRLVASFAATYFLHSTLLLAGCWLVLKTLQNRSHFLTERLWKLGAVLGLVTAALQGLLTTVPFALRLSDPAAVVTTGDRSLGAAFEKVAASDSMKDFVETEPPAGLSLPSAGSAEAHIPILDGQPHEGLRVDPAPAARSPSHASHAPFTDTSETTIPPRAPPADSNGRKGASVWRAMAMVAVPLVLVVCIAGAVLLCVQTVRLARRYSGGRLLTAGPARHALDRFLKRNRIRRRIRLLASTKYSEPVTYGVLRWTIVLPEGTEDHLQHDELRALLAHEVAHLVRGDVWWLWIGRVLCTCLAFQPLNLLARRKWQQAAEYLCDDWAVARGIRSISLARCLTCIAEWRCGAPSCALGLPATGTKATLVQRVERLVAEERQADAWTRPFRRKLLAVGAAIIVVGLAGFAPRIAVPISTFRAPEAADRVALDPSVDDATRRDWDAVQHDLSQLEIDLDRVRQLKRSNEPTEVAALRQNLNRRSASLRARREHIASLLEKESQR